jgi:group I intron endonuclease
MVGIYKITNPNNKVYIGQSINIKERFRKYSKLSNKRQIKLYNSFQKHGITNHQFEIIEECSEDMLNEREIYWGNYYNVLEDEGLNLRLGNGRGSCSKNTKSKISKSLKGKKKSKEHCANLSIAKTGIPSPRKGKPDLKQKGKPKPGAGGKGILRPGAGPKTGKHILYVDTGEVFLSVKECMEKFGFHKKQMYIHLNDENSKFKKINKTWSY